MAQGRADRTRTGSPAVPGTAPGSGAPDDAGARFRPLVSLFGVIWLLNAAFQFSAWLRPPGGAGGARLLHVFSKAVGAAPSWLRPLLAAITGAVSAIGPHWIALAMVAIALLLGLSLVFGVRLRTACWAGIVYSAFCWVALCALGYPYAGGQTDPGVFPAYLIAFVFVLSLTPMLAPRPGAPPAAWPTGTLWAAGRLLFGLLWAFDAALKWLPAFLAHFLDQLTPAMQGQPAWIAAYIGVIILVVKAVGPMLVAVTIALIETAMAASLLAGQWLRFSLPLGFLYSLAVWTSAEGFGGPYSAAGTGVRGNVLGNVLIYAVIFLFLMVPQGVRPGSTRRAASGA